MKAGFWVRCLFVLSEHPFAIEQIWKMVVSFGSAEVNLFLDGIWEAI